jgi:hypothetical protein
MNRALSVLQAEGLIRVEYGGIRLMNRRALRARPKRIRSVGS